MSISTSSPIKIMIAENHQIVAHSIAALLRTNENFDIQGIAHSGKELLKLLDKNKPDIVLMEINMPEMNGVEATRAIDERMPWVKVIALTIVDQAVFVKKMFKAGAKGFVSKNSMPEDLFTAIRLVYEGKTYCCQTTVDGFITDSGEFEQDKGRQSKPALTSSELEIIKLIAEGYLTREIAERTFISEKTVERHKTNILKKFNLRNSSQLVKMAVEQGWLYY
jgi:two-component system, NarL family, response regulator DegU